MCENKGGSTVSSNDNEDESFKYDNALKISFDDSDVSVDFMDEEMDNVIDYQDAQEGTRNKKETKVGRTQVR